LIFVPGKRIDLGTIQMPFKKPNLIQHQLEAFDRFIEERLPKLFAELNPVEDNTGKVWRLEFGKVRVLRPNRSEKEAREKNLSYDAPLYVSVRLVNKKTGEVKEKDIFMGNIPIMTPRGTFIVSGNERVIIMQIVRSEGVIFIPNGLELGDHTLYMAQLMPEKGGWITIDVNKQGVISVKLAPRKPRVLYTTLLRALGWSSDAEIASLFEDIERDDEFKFIDATLYKDKTKSVGEAVFDIYSKLRPDMSVSYEAASNYLYRLLFDPRVLYLGKTGRYQLNKKLEERFRTEMTEDFYTLRKEDFIGVGRALIAVNIGKREPDDIDHLGNRRIRRVDELLAEHLRESFARLERSIKDKMSVHSSRESVDPLELINTKPIIQAFNDFFGTSSVSRYMDQLNCLSELAVKREITAGGPGGLTKERASFSVRDVHPSHYGRICAVETPDGQNIGVVNRLALYAKINEYGFIEAPYRKVYHFIEINKPSDIGLLVNRICGETVKDKNGKVVIRKGEYITKELAPKIGSIEKKIKVFPFVTEDIVYLTADEEDDSVFATCNVQFDKYGNILDRTVPVRRRGTFFTTSANKVDYIDIDSAQIAGTSFGIIPFAENDDPHRTLLSAGTVKQALPLVFPESPIVGTAIGDYLAKECLYGIYADADGVVEAVDANRIIIRTDDNKKKIYDLDVFRRTNNNTEITQRPVVSLGQRVKSGDLLADGGSMDKGEIALGTNLLCAVMFYEGYTFEDGIVVSERAIREDKFTTVLINEYSVEVRETKLGPEVVTADIPNVSEYALRNLDKDGIVRIGAKVKAHDILVGIVAPKGEFELTAEEKLLRAIFGEHAKDVRDNSLYVPHGEGGIVIRTQVLSKSKGDQLPSGVLKQVKVWVAKIHRLNIGDKLTDFHSQKGVVCKIVPDEDMPYLEDGTPIDVIFNPLFLKRMNVGMIKEMYWGNIANALGVKFSVHQFAPLNERIVFDELRKRGIEVKEKVRVYDGRTGEPYDAPIVVGPKYILKLEHMADAKVHARSIGRYTIVTQQPLGGKAQFGGQRFGEMEVWALEAHGAAHTLLEMLTIKSDDIVGRSKAYDAIVHGNPVEISGIPETVKVFITELRSLGLNPIPLKINPVKDEKDEEKDKNNKDTKDGEEKT